MLAAFGDVESASLAVSNVIGAGIVPAALEMMDALTIEAVEPQYHAGYPMDAGAVLLIEIDGIARMWTHTAEEIAAICCQAGASRSSSREREEASATCSGRGGRWPWRRWAGSRRTTTCMTPWCRGRSFRPRSRGSRKSRSEFDLGSPMSFTPAMAIFTR